MGEIHATLSIVLAVVAYAAQARALGRELRELVERRREELAREQIEGDDAELIARELELRYTRSQLEDVRSIDLSGIEGLGG
jgi:hypothetical protein